MNFLRPQERPWSVLQYQTFAVQQSKNVAHSWAEWLPVKNSVTRAIDFISSMYHPKKPLHLFQADLVDRFMFWQDVLKF